MPSLSVGAGMPAGGPPPPPPPTVIGAVGPVPTTVSAPPSAVAWFVYVPGVEDTVTPKWSTAVPPGGTAIGPAQVSVLAAIVGSAVVAPVDEPGVYVKPAGSVSVIE